MTLTAELSMAKDTLLEDLTIYAVGGCVRDRLLCHPVRDWDYLVVGATPDEMLRRGFRQVGADFPVFLHPETGEEYALARTERKVAPGYRGFQADASPGVTLEDDLARRDLTINAIAEAADGRVIDPFGGRRDLAAGVLRHVGPAFRDDPVRLLRVARFRARYGFDVAPETLQMMRDMVAAGEVDALVPERVWQETLKALGEVQAPLFFETLRECGALARVFPEIDRLFGVPQPPAHHPEIDTGLHTLMVLDVACSLTEDPLVRFAALVHDLGKGVTPEEEWPRHIGHEKRGVAEVERLCRRLKVPNDYRELGRLVSEHHLRAHNALTMTPRKVARLFEAVDAYRRPGRFEQFLIACEADARGRAPAETWQEPDVLERRKHYRKPYSQARHLQRLLKAAQGVSGAELAQAGLSGERLRQALHAGRVRAIGLAAGENASQIKSETPSSAREAGL